MDLRDCLGKRISLLKDGRLVGTVVVAVAAQILKLVVVEVDCEESVGTSWCHQAGIVEGREADRLHIALQHRRVIVLVVVQTDVIHE